MNLISLYNAAYRRKCAVQKFIIYQSKSTVHYNSIQDNTVQHNTIQYNTIQY